MAAGLEALPYHDLVPSFGEWGWWLAQAYSPPAAGELPMAPMGSTGPRLQQLYAQSRLSGRIQLRYLSDSIMQANVVFSAPVLRPCTERVCLYFHMNSYLQIK